MEIISLQRLALKIILRILKIISLQRYRKYALVGVIQTVSRVTPHCREVCSGGNLKDLGNDNFTVEAQLRILRIILIPPQRAVHLGVIQLQRCALGAILRILEIVSSLHLCK